MSLLVLNQELKQDETQGGQSHNPNNLHTPWTNDVKGLNTSYKPMTWHPELYIYLFFLMKPSAKQIRSKHLNVNEY
jgi:hypothetical protein